MKLILSTLAIVLCLGITGNSNAVERNAVETWECTESPFGTEILVVAEVNECRVTGEIAVAGEKYKTFFKITGSGRRWDFGEDFKYALTIMPGGEGKYYDFTNAESDKTTQPSYLLDCKMK